jgi:putative ABC transport system permease protein
MSFIDGLVHRIRVWSQPAAYDRSIDEEMRLHLALDAGRSSAHDPYAARKRFGNVTAMKEQTREVAGLGAFDGMTQDARHLVRSLRRSPGFAIVAILTLALGIGTTSAVLSIVDHVLLHALPFRDPARLMMMLESDGRGGLRPPSYPTVADWRRDPGATEAFEGLSFVRGDGVLLDRPDGAERILAGFVSDDFFPLLGAAPLLGRALLPEDQKPGSPPVVVLSYALWQDRFGGDRSILGRRVTLDSLPTTVVGVMPTGAAYPTFAQVWQPLARYSHQEILMRRGLHADSRTIGRLRPGIDSARAVTLMKVVGARLASAYPAEQDRWSASLIPVQTEILGNVKPMLLTLAAAAAVVLLLACANVANLLLARMSTRARELAVRSALGASRRRLVRQLLTESVLLAVIGGALGTALAAFAVELARKLPPDRLPRVEELSVDGRVLAIAAAASLLTALLCGVWPAMRATRPTSGESLRSGSQGSVGGRADSRLRRSLVIIQFSLALVLLVGAGLLLLSFRRVGAVSVGFEPAGLVTVAISPSGPEYREPAQTAALYARLIQAMRAVPGVEDAAVINHFPFSGASITTPIQIEGRSTIDTASNDVLYRTVSDSYLHTMKMRLAGGRWFSDGDMRSPAGSFVVNKTLATKFWPGESAIGKRFTVRRSSQARADFGQPLSGTVIGVVNDVSQFSQDAVPAPEVYVPYTLEVWPWATLVTRTRDGARAIPALRRAALGVEPRLVLSGGQAARNYSSVESLIATSLEQRRLAMTLIGVFAGCALVLAAIGMYGVIAYGITQRTREMGVRKALGATDRMIARLVIGESLRLTGAGIAIGCLGAWAGAKLISGLLFDTGAADPVAYIATIALLTLVALLATYLPARRATRLDPTIAMRGE